MKMLITICSAVGLITTLPLMAEANTCSDSLLSRPIQHIQGELDLSTWQARRLGTIQHDTHKRHVGLQRQLSRVQLELDQLRRVPHDPVAMVQLEQQQASLVRRLDHITSRASSQALMLLNPWQRQRCERSRPPRMAMLVEPPPPPPEPHVVVVRHRHPGLKVVKRSKRIRQAPPQHIYHLPPRHQRRAGKRVVVHRAPPAPKSTAPKSRRQRRR
jgi:hypothetical protein